MSNELDGGRAILKYDGKYDWMPGDSRQWTIQNHWLDAKGQDRYRGSFTAQGLVDLGVIRNVKG